jgi:hypothetical protein
MDLASLAPTRSAEDILSGRVRLAVGEEHYDLPALPIKENRLWKADIDSRLQMLIGGIDAAGTDTGTILALLTDASDQLMDLLLSYDQSHVLPDREVLEATMTEPQLLTAVLEVWAAANPLVGMGLAALPTTMPAPPTNVSSLPTSSQRRRTAGRPRTSKAS